MRSKSGLVWSAHNMGHALDAAAHESGVRSRVDHQQSSSPQFFSQPIGWRMHYASGGRETRLADPRPAVQGGRRGTRPGIAIEAGLAHSSSRRTLRNSHDSEYGWILTANKTGHQRGSLHCDRIPTIKLIDFTNERSECS